MGRISVSDGLLQLASGIPHLGLGRIYLIAGLPDPLPGILYPLFILFIGFQQFFRLLQLLFQRHSATTFLCLLKNLSQTGR